MCMVIDFAKYQAEREIEAFFLENNLSNMQFVCPDCRGEQFQIYLDMTAKCSGCELEVLLQLDEEL